MPAVDILKVTQKGATRGDAACSPPLLEHFVYRLSAQTEQKNAWYRLALILFQLQEIW